MPLATTTLYCTRYLGFSSVTTSYIKIMKISWKYLRYSEEICRMQTGPNLREWRCPLYCCLKAILAVLHMVVVWVLGAEFLHSCTLRFAHSSSFGHILCRVLCKFYMNGACRNPSCECRSFCIGQGISCIMVRRMPCFQHVWRICLRKTQVSHPAKHSQEMEPPAHHRSLEMDRRPCLWSVEGPHVTHRDR